MRRLIALALLVGAVLVLPTMAMGVDNDVKGPPCADVIGGSGSSGAVLIDLAAAPCSAVTYTLNVYTDASMAHPLVALTDYDVVTPTQIGFNELPPDSDGIVCVSLTTSVGGGKHVFDTAPDANLGCVDATTTSSGGFGGFS